MANYANLKTAIQNVIKTNGNNEITGRLLQQSLLSMINSFGSGYQFIGVATPTTNPGSPDQKVFYIANGKGTYTNFGGVEVTEDDVVVLCWDSSWRKVLTGIASQAKLSELGQVVEENAIYESSAIYEQDETLIDASSPYYVSYLDSAWLDLGINNGKITSNQYTGNYRLFLFNLPAGKYNLRLKADTTKDVGAIFATIGSEGDFVVGTQTTVLFSGDGTDQSHIVDFAKDTLLIFEALKDNFYNFGSVSEVKFGTLKGKVAEHDSRIRQLENAVFADGPVQDSELVMGVLRTDGTFATYDTDEGFWRSDYIYCKGMPRVNFSKVANNKYLSSYAIYDENKNVLQKVVGESGTTTNQDYEVDLTQIPGAFYLAFSITTATKNAHNWSVIVRRSRIEDIENKIKPLELEILIPDTIFAIVGTELNLWNDAVSLSVDNSLYSPRNYVTEWVCNKGIVTKRGYRYTPTDSDSGNSYSCKCIIFDSINHVQIATRVFTIKVLAKNALSSAKNIVHFGDSLGENTAVKLYDNFNDSAKYTGSIPKMLGTRGTGQKRCEAVGGWTWASYATAGVTGYRIYVSGVSSMSVGAIYTDGKHNFEVYEVNISDGNGNCLLGPYFTNPGTLIMPSGTLSKVSGSGDNSVPYTDAFQESVNPLWNDSTNKLDLNHYKQTLVSLGQLNSVSDKIDAVSFQFGVNESLGSPNLITILNNYIIPLYNLFVNDNPDCKFIVGLTTSAGNDVDGAGANYGASRDIWGYLRNTYNFRKMYLEELQNNVNYPNLIIAPSELLIDRYYGYGFSTRQISQRTIETEQYHNNFVHPDPAGYGQLADALFATYIGALIG